MKNFDDLKIKVLNESHSREIQKLLFTLGYSWGDLYKPYIHGEQYRFTDHAYLYGCTDGQIRCGYGYTKDHKIFENCSARLVTVENISYRIRYGNF